MSFRGGSFRFRVLRHQFGFRRFGARLSFFSSPAARGCMLQGCSLFPVYTCFCFSSINKGRNIHSNGLWDQMFDGYFFSLLFFLFNGENVKWIEGGIQMRSALDLLAEVQTGRQVVKRRDSFRTAGAVRGQ